MTRYLPNSTTKTLKDGQVLLYHGTIPVQTLLQLANYRVLIEPFHFISSELISLTNNFNIEPSIEVVPTGELRLTVEPFGIRLILDEIFQCSDQAKLNITVLRYKKNKVSPQDIKVYLSE